MQTVRQIERLWTAQQYKRLFAELVSNRVEGAFKFDREPGSVAAAAMGMIRLDELNQSHAPLYSALVRAVAAAQEKDGGWGDVTISALCLRALMLGREPGGEAIQRGLSYLATLQKDDGLWPKVPIRRLPGDAAATAIVLHQLADSERFRKSVRFDDALHWFTAHQITLEPGARRLWDRAALKCRPRRQREPMLIWS